MVDDAWPHSTELKTRRNLAGHSSRCCFANMPRIVTLVRQNVRLGTCSVGDVPGSNCGRGVWLCSPCDVLLRRSVNWGGAAALAAAWMAWPAIDKDFKKDLLSGKVFKKDEDKK